MIDALVNVAIECPRKAHSKWLRQPTKLRENIIPRYAPNLGRTLLCLFAVDQSPRRRSRAHSIAKSSSASALLK
jgi:hypothetical protein